MTSSGTLRFFADKDADPHALDNERVAVIGYGNLGRALALNLRDWGRTQLVVGNINDQYAEQARADGFSVLPIGEAVAASTIVLILLPDEIIPEAFGNGGSIRRSVSRQGSEPDDSRGIDDIASNLAPGSAIVFASGYTLAYGLIKPPTSVDVLLLAPRMGGELARERYLSGQGFFAYVSVEQEASSRAWARLLGIAHAVGVLQTGALELDARTEADLDLFIEQTIGAVVGVAIMSAFARGVDVGIPPEAMVLEMYMSGEMETVFRAFREKGFFRASDTHGPTALFGGFLRTMQLMQSDLDSRFCETLEEIQSGRFAKQFQAEREAGYPMLSQAQLMAAEESPVTRPIVQAETRVREMLNGFSASDEIGV